MNRGFKTMLALVVITSMLGMAVPDATDPYTCQPQDHQVDAICAETCTSGQRCNEYHGGDVEFPDACPLDDYVICDDGYATPSYMPRMDSSCCANPTNRACFSDSIWGCRALPLNDEGTDYGSVDLADSCPDLPVFEYVQATADDAATLLDTYDLTSIAKCKITCTDDHGSDANLAVWDDYLDTCACYTATSIVSSTNEDSSARPICSCNDIGECEDTDADGNAQECLALKNDGYVCCKTSNICGEDHKQCCGDDQTCFPNEDDEVDQCHNNPTFST